MEGMKGKKKSYWMTALKEQYIVYFYIGEEVEIKTYHTSNLTAWCVIRFKIFYNFTHTGGNHCRLGRFFVTVTA